MKKQLNSAKSEKGGNPSKRRDFLKKASIGALGIGFLGSNDSVEIAESKGMIQSRTDITAKIKITDLRCAIIGSSPVVHIKTDAGISGFGQAETAKAFLKPYILFYKDYLIGEDPINVERVMMKIRRIGGFRPWGAAVSAIEMALWDIAGKAAEVPVYKLLGGKVRDRVRVYRTGMRFPASVAEPGEYAKSVKEAKEGFTIIKDGIGFHSNMHSTVPNFFYGEPPVSGRQAKQPKNNPKADTIQSIRYPTPRHGGPLTEVGLKHMISYVENMKRGLGDEIGLALDCGPGFMVSDAIRLARALEPFNLMWLEDLITGDYTPYVMADLYREVTQATSTPIHTGEQIYLRQNFRELIEQHAVRIIGPDPSDIGGIAELKWVAEFADLHGIQIAPHGRFNGLIGLAAQVQVGATMPENFIAFEYSYADPVWWYDIIEGLPDPIIKNGLIEVWDSPGLGVAFNIIAAKQYLSEEDKDFFD